MIQIIPSILATTEEQFQQDLKKLSDCEALKDGWIHIDFADNKFVQNETIGVDTVAKFPMDFRKEAHLMVSHPLQWVDKCLDGGFERIIFHIESEDNMEECIEYIKNKGVEVGLAINNDTPVEKLQPYSDKIDIVLVMTIVAGFQGQPFIPEMLDKVKMIKNSNLSVKVGVDGAVNDGNAKEIVESGVDFMVAGSFLLKGNTDENLENIWEVLS